MWEYKLCSMRCENLEHPRRWTFLWTFQAYPCLLCSRVICWQASKTAATPCSVSSIASSSPPQSVRNGRTWLLQYCAMLDRSAASRTPFLKSFWICSNRHRHLGQGLACGLRLEYPVYHQPACRGHTFKGRSGLTCRRLVDTSSHLAGSLRFRT